MTNEFDWKQWWNRNFPDAPPLAQVLRHTYDDRWLRIHSLPESKRYPSNKTEYAEMLRRQNQVATDILKDGGECILVEGSWDKVETPEDWPSDTWHIEGNDDFAFRETVSEVVWNSGNFDPLLKEIADFQRPCVLWISKESKGIFAPYDGGVDLIYSSEKERDQRKREYKNWLSKHPQGF